MSGIWNRALKSTPFHVGFAFLAMGGWGIHANYAHPMPDPLLAGFTQGVMSALLTLFLKKSVDWMRPRFSRYSGYWAPPFIASLSSAVFLLFGHLVSGTPEVLITIAVPLAVSVTYIFTYNITRHRKFE